MEGGQVAALCALPAAAAAEMETAEPEAPNAEAIHHAFSISVPLYV